MTEPQVVYYQAEGLNSTIRYVWSLVGAPTVFVSVTNDGFENCTESVERAFNWTEFVSNQSFGSVTFPGEDGDFSFAVVFNQLIEFNDTNASLSFDASDLSDGNMYRNFSLSGLHWWYNSSNQTLVAKSSSNSLFRWIIQVSLLKHIYIYIYISLSLSLSLSFSLSAYPHHFLHHTHIISAFFVLVFACLSSSLMCASFKCLSPLTHS